MLRVDWRVGECPTAPSFDPRTSIIVQNVLEELPVRGEIAEKLPQPHRAQHDNAVRVMKETDWIDNNTGSFDFGKGHGRKTTCESKPANYLQLFTGGEERRGWEQTILVVTTTQWWWWLHGTIGPVCRSFHRNPVADLGANNLYFFSFFYFFIFVLLCRKWCGNVLPISAGNKLSLGFSSPTSDNAPFAETNSWNKTKFHFIHLSAARSTTEAIESNTSCQVW